MERSRTAGPLGSMLLVAAFAIGAGIAGPSHCETPVAGPGTKALPRVPAWSITGDLQVARCGGTATLLTSGKVLVVGGSNGGDCTGDTVATLGTAELYDPVTGSWTVTGSLKQPRTNHTATLLPSGLVLVVGGQVASPGHFQTISTAELYDPVSGSWSSTGTPTAQRVYHTATLLQNGKVLVAGGCCAASGAPASAELYDPSTGTWSGTGNLVAGRFWHTATLLRNGKVLVAGGLLYAPATMGQIKGSAELYDSVTGAWSATGELNNDRAQHTATLLPDGRVLVASGESPYDDYGGTPGTAEIYDPITARWSDTGNLGAIRNGHTATLLPGGKVLVVGGVYFSTSNRAELYDSASGSWTPSGGLTVPRFFGHTARSLQMGGSWLRRARAKTSLQSRCTSPNSTMTERCLRQTLA